MVSRICFNNLLDSRSRYPALGCLIREQIKTSFGFMITPIGSAHPIRRLWGSAPFPTGRFSRHLVPIPIRPALLSTSPSSSLIRVLVCFGCLIRVLVCFSKGWTERTFRHFCASSGLAWSDNQFSKVISYGFGRRISFHL
jgi:hypothetical protein